MITHPFYFMAHVTFYLMNEPSVAAQAMTEKYQLVCSLVTDLFRQNQTIFVLCQTQAEADMLDEMLWQQDPDSFVPHGLSEESTVMQAPVEIGTLQPRRFRQVLVNISDAVSPHANRFAQIVDFVPVNESEKQQARERYKQYRALGFTLETVPAPVLP